MSERPNNESFKQSYTDDNLSQSSGEGTNSLEVNHHTSKKNQQLTNSIGHQKESTKKTIDQLNSKQKQQDASKTNNKKLFWLLSIGNATGQTFIFNFFTAFAAEVGVTGTLMGILTSTRNLISAIFQGSIGRLSDKYGRKYFLLVGFLLCTITVSLLIFFQSPVMLILISIIQAFSFSIIIPVWNGTLGDITEKKKRASFIGQLSSLGTIFSVTFMLAIAGMFYLFTDVYQEITIFNRTFILTWQIQYGIAFGIAAANFLICAVGIFFLRETNFVTQTQEQPRLLSALSDKRFRTFLIVNSIFGFFMAAGWPVFPIGQVNVLGMTFSQIAINSAVFSTCSSLAQFFGGKMGDRYGRKPLIIFGRVAMFLIPLIYAIAALMGKWSLLIITNIIGGTSVGIVAVAQNAYVLDLSPEETMGAYSGLTQVAWGIATFLGSFITGFIIDILEKAVGTVMMVVYLFIAIAILRGISSCGYFFIAESLDKKELSEKELKETTVESLAKSYSETLEEGQFRTK
jgi:MFS family permease